MIPGHWVGLSLRKDWEAGFGNERLLLETQGEHIRELPGNVASIIKWGLVSGRKIYVFKVERLNGKPSCLLWG